jgi:hypothetical protein
LVPGISSGPWSGTGGGTSKGRDGSSIDIGHLIGLGSSAMQARLTLTHTLKAIVTGRVQLAARGLAALLGVALLLPLSGCVSQGDWDNLYGTNRS